MYKYIIYRHTNKISHTHTIHSQRLLRPATCTVTEWRGPTVCHGPSHRAVTSLQAGVEVTTLQTVGWQLDGKRGADWCWWQMQKGIYCWPPEPFLNFFLFLRLDQLLSFLVTEGPHHASAFPQGDPADVRHVIHFSIAQLARECPCSPWFAAYEVECSKLTLCFSITSPSSSSSSSSCRRLLLLLRRHHHYHYHCCYYHHHHHGYYYYDHYHYCYFIIYAYNYNKIIVIIIIIIIIIIPTCMGAAEVGVGGWWGVGGGSHLT